MHGPLPLAQALSSPPPSRRPRPRKLCKASRKVSRMTHALCRALSVSIQQAMQPSHPKISARFAACSENCGHASVRYEHVPTAGGNAPLPGPRPKISISTGQQWTGGPVQPPSCTENQISAQARDRESMKKKTDSLLSVNLDACMLVERPLPAVDFRLGGRGERRNASSDTARTLVRRRGRGRGGGGGGR